MSFWKFEFKPTSAIDTILDQEDVKLTQILNEEDVIQECKVQNRKLIDYLIQPAILDELVQLVSQEPPDVKDERMRFKFSHVACEILTSEVVDVLNGLCSEENLLVRLWDFLDTPPPLNPLVGSFLSRVLSVLLNHKCPIILKFLQEKENFLDLFVQHLGTSAICDLLLQMIAAPDTDQSRLDLAVWLSESGLVRMLVDLMRVGVEEELCMNVAQLLGDVVRIGRESFQMVSPSPIVLKLEERASISRLMGNMFDEGAEEEQSDLVLVSGISFLLSLVEPRRNPNPFDIHQTPVDDDMACLQNALTVLVERLGSFKDVLTRQSKLQPQETTVGRLEEPFGSTRLQVLKLFSLLLSVNSEEVYQHCIDCNILSLLLDLFIRYPWNNFLHLQVELCVNAVLEMDALGICETTPIQTHLFKECFLLKKLLEAHNVNEQSISLGQRRQGYMGHLIRLVNSIKKWYESRPALKESVQSVTEEDTWAQWCNYITGPVAESNRRNDMMLGGQRTLNSSFDDSEDDFDPHNLGPGQVLEKEYSEYRSAVFVVPFEDDYGSDILDTHEEGVRSLFEKPTTVLLTTTADEQHPEHASSFASVCVSRIRQFDDSSPEEDVEGDSAQQGLLMSMEPWDDKDIQLNSTFDRNSSALFSSSEDEDCEQIFELQTKKLSTEEDYLNPEEDGERGEGDGGGPVGGRAKDYMVGCLGADSRTHTDLSQAGLEDVVFRDRIISGSSEEADEDSDEDSDDDELQDVRAVVGLGSNLEWTREAGEEPLEGAGQTLEGAGWADFDANERKLQAEEKGEGKEENQDQRRGVATIPATRAGEEEGKGAQSTRKTDGEELQSGKKEAAATTGDSHSTSLASAEPPPAQDPTGDAGGREEGRVVAVGSSPESSSSSGDGGSITTTTASSDTISPVKNDQVVQEVVSDSEGRIGSNSSTAEQQQPVVSGSSIDVLSQGMNRLSLGLTATAGVQEEVASQQEVKPLQQEVASQQEVKPLQQEVASPDSQDVRPSKPECMQQPKQSCDSHVTPAACEGLQHQVNAVDDDDDDGTGTPVDGEVPAFPQLPNGPTSNNVDFGTIQLEFDMDGDDDDDDELSNNFSFLQGGLISKSAGTGDSNEHLRRIKQEAQEACRQYEQETGAQ